MADELLNLVRGVRFPEYGHEHNSAKSSLRVLTLRLRKAYYDAAPMREDVYAIPFGGPIGASIGPWPEFILRGLPCQKSQLGCCTPCFYSRMPQVSCSVEKIYDSLIDQVAYILRNFEGLVVRNQYGPVAMPRYGAQKPVAFVLTPTGSFFDEIEFPLNVRNRVLEMLLDHSRIVGYPFAVYVQTHAENFLSASDNREFARTTSLLKELNARVLFGYESSNPFVRNVLYNKYLEQQVFLTAVNRARDAGLGVGAFAFVGISPLNDIEILCDAIGTFGFLADKRISPVVMFPNVQPYTIQELLFVYHAHNLPEPRTVLEAVRHLVTALPEYDNGTMDSWLIADPVGGPPPPKYNIFTSKRACVTCIDCTRRIYKALVELRQTRDTKTFLATYELLSTCQCASAYYELLRKQVEDTSGLEQRMSRMIQTVQDKVGDYVSVVRPLLDEVEDYAAFEDSVPRHGGPDEPAAQLKAELLCYGIRIDPGIREDVLKFNSYIHEGGFAHAAHFVLGTHLVNACVAETFCEASPFLLKRGNGKYQLTRNDNDAFLVPCEVLASPEWCSKLVGGFRLGDVLRPHSKDVISGMPNPVCCYFKSNEECTFCSLGPYQERAVVPPEVVAEAAIVAHEHNPHSELALSGGTSDTPDRSARYFAKIAQEVMSRTSMPISVELAPPQDNAFLELLKEAGVTAVIMNIEIWDEDLRAVYCPGKSKITMERYLEAIDYGVKLFGRGRVSSVLIAGLQSPATVVEGAGALIARGAIPTIIPFKPFDGSKMARAPVTNPADVTVIHAEVSNLLRAHDLVPKLQPGCTGCGGCSLENLQSGGGPG